MKNLLFILLLFTAITSIPSGVLLMLKPDGAFFNMPLSMLNATPFKNFLIPGMALLVAVGGANLVALIKNIKHQSNRYSWAIAAGAILCGWIGIQILLINAMSWLHFLYGGIGLLTVLTAYQLKGKWAV
jgi:hypothetical protein